MTQRVLVPVDGSPLSRESLEHAASTFPGAELIVLHVVDPVGALYEAEGGGPAAADEWAGQAREEAERLCEDVATPAAEEGCTVTTLVDVGRPGRAILEAIDERDVDHVVMGSHGRKGLSRLVLGSVAERVVRESPVPVTVVR